MYLEAGVADFKAIVDVVRVHDTGTARKRVSRMSAQQVEYFSPVTEDAKKYGNRQWIQRHGPRVNRRLRDPGCFLALHFCVQERDHVVEEVRAMSRNIVCQPLVEIQIFSSRSQSRNIKRKSERPDI